MFPWLEVISALSPLILGVITIVLRKDIQELHLMVNSRLTQLVEAEKGKSRGEGHAEGRAEVNKEIAKLDSK